LPLKVRSLSFLLLSFHRPVGKAFQSNPDQVPAGTPGIVFDLFRQGSACCHLHPGALNFFFLWFRLLGNWFIAQRFFSLSTLLPIFFEEHYVRLPFSLQVFSRARGRSRISSANRRPVSLS